MRTLGRLVAFGLVVTWFVLFRPVAIGGSASYEVVTGTSMEPLLHTGDLVITQSQATYGVGDLIVFHVPTGQPGAGSSVIHRVVGGDGIDGFIVKGDNKPAPDSWHPKTKDVVGRSWIQLPGSGALLLILRRPLVIAAIAGGLVGFWFLTTDLKLPDRPRRGVGVVPPWRRREPEGSPDETTAC